MPLSPEMERLKKAAASKSEDEAGVIADAAAELENTAALPVAVAAFARAAGIDPVAIQTAPEATAQAFSRELADLKAAQSALPKPPSPETAAERRRVLAREIERLNAPTNDRQAFDRDFTDKLADLLAGSPAKPNVAMLSRDDGDDDFRAMKIVQLLDKAGPPPSGQFAGGREAPRQAPDNGGQQTPDQLREEGRQQGEKLNRQQLERMGIAAQ